MPPPPPPRAPATGRGRPRPAPAPGTCRPRGDRRRSTRPRCRGSNARAPRRGRAGAKLTAASRRSPPAERSSPACRLTAPRSSAVPLWTHSSAPGPSPLGDTTSRTWPVAAPVPTSTAAPARSAGPLAGRSVRRPKESAVRRNRSIHTSSRRLASPAGGPGSVPSSAGAVASVSHAPSTERTSRSTSSPAARSPRACTSPRALALATGSSSDDHGSPPAPRRAARRRPPSSPDPDSPIEPIGSEVGYADRARSGGGRR